MALTFDLKSYLDRYRQQVETALDTYLPMGYPPKIYEAMRYSLLAGGKRLRPILVLASCELCGGTPDWAMPTAVAVEMIHTMSLIHDDLPAMDNDDYRRGKPTNHKVFGEDIAILAGDGLLAYAFQVIADRTPLEVPRDRVVRVIGLLARSVSAAGLVGGQVVDLEMEGNPHATEEMLDYIHKHKTAALLEAAVVGGAIVAGASDQQIELLRQYSQNIGLAFQIIDDILDITSTPEELGKSVGKDEKAQKLTYPKLWGIATSQQKAQALIQEAKQLLATFGDRAIPLQSLADYIVERTN
ncbi:MAG: polyprenyl synthetase family protein [Pseudanabaenaceae cyanobacterium SKYGB_i_bin29]|nr:polyprenyl synthetase family protein [Pseudanabaenaceae cyanobacterium SKYG29]MDW8420912.1 polyprenyl synthetase family protein [Pseudanabaenaceae cyanobacterium SKYGB_i_bin29]